MRAGKVISRIGERVIEWNPAVLDRVLDQLRSERNAEVDANHLIAQATRIKDDPTQYLEI